MIVLLLTLAVSLAESELPEKGQLCWMQSREVCVSTSGTLIESVPFDVARRYVWTSDDGSNVVIGELEAAKSAIDLSAATRRTVELSLVGDIRRGWPQQTRLTLSQGKEKIWDWRVSPRQIDTLRTIAVPAGDYLLSIAAPRHRIERRRISAKQNVSLKEIPLKPLPAVFGKLVRINDEKRLTVVGASINSPDGKVSTTSGDDGAFRLELNEPLPTELVIVHSGLATQLISLDERHPDAETDLGEIVLSKGAKLLLKIKQSPEKSETVNVRLLQPSRDKYELVPVRSLVLARGEEDLVLPNLASGKYHILLEGDGPLERFSEEVEIGDLDVEKSVTIEPYRLEGSARFGTEPLSGTIELIFLRAWRATLPIASSGAFEATLWQPGKLSGFLKSDALGGGHPLESPQLGSDPSEWKIELKRRLIEGRITDAATGQALPGVSLELQVASGDDNRRFYTSVAVDPAGNYRIPAIRDGIYDLKVSHRERLPITRSVELGADGESQRIDFALEQGIEMKLEVVWPDGSPVASAQVLEGVSRDGHNPLRLMSTDGAGRLTLRSSSREVRTLFVLPKEGSFAIVRLVAPSNSSDDRSMRVVVPAPAGSLRITFRDEQGEPAPRIPLLRYNGDWIPLPASMRLRNDTESRNIIRILALPAGAYEIWGLAPGRDFSDVKGGPPAPPVRVGVTAGEVAVEVRVPSRP